MGPHTGKARQHILVVGQLYLHFCVGGLGPLGKYLQYKACTVYNVRAGDYLFYITLLHAREFIVKDYVLYLVGLTVFLYFFKLAGANVCCLVWPVHALGEHFVTRGAGGFCKELQLLQILLHLALATLFQNGANKNGFIGLKLAHIQQI